MKIQVLSDLHCEFLWEANSIDCLVSEVPVCDAAEVVIFAGDIDKGAYFIEMANHYRQAGQQFVSNLEQSLFAKATLWVHGHSHSSADYFLGDCHVVANPRGYPISKGKFENEFFAPHKIVEI